MDPQKTVVGVICRIIRLLAASGSRPSTLHPIKSFIEFVRLSSQKTLQVRGFDPIRGGHVAGMCSATMGKHILLNTLRPFLHDACTPVMARLGAARRTAKRPLIVCGCCFEKLVAATG